MTRKRRLAINMRDLTTAFALRFDGVQTYFDMETGEVLEVSSEIRDMLEELAAELHTVEDGPIPLQDLLARHPEIPVWQKRALLKANRVELGLGSRIIAVEPDRQDDYRDMENFIAALDDKQFADELLVIIRKRGAFRNFKDAMTQHYPPMQKAWQSFRAACVEERVREWLDSYGIEPI